MGVIWVYERWRWIKKAAESQGKKGGKKDKKTNSIFSAFSLFDTYRAVMFLGILVGTCVRFRLEQLYIVPERVHCAPA